MCRDDLLDFPGPDLVTAFRSDQILQAVDDENVTVVVDVAKVAGVQPAASAAVLDVIGRPDPLAWYNAPPEARPFAELAATAATRR